MKHIFVILVILLVCILIFISLNFKESFKNIRNIFTTSIFYNKTVFLIANNPNISEKTKHFLDNYNYKDTLIVRFNGYKPIIKDYCKGKTDIMVYRKKRNGFWGYNKRNYNKNIINIFTNDLGKNESEFDKYYNIEDEKYLIHNSLYNIKIGGNVFKELNYPKKCKCSWTTGFNFLIYLLNLKNIKKIYLIGFSFHNKKNSCHCELWEYNYFKKNIENKKNIELLL